MANRPDRFKKSELTSALQAPLECGQSIARYDITDDGKVVQLSVHLIGGGTVVTNITTLEERCEASAQARRLAGRRG